MASSSDTNSAEAAWIAVQARVRDELGWLRSEWLDGLRLRSADNGTVALEASSQEVREEAQAWFDELKAAAKEAWGRPIRLRLQVSKRRRSTRKQPSPAEAVELATERVSDTHQLSSFLTGAEGAVPLRFALEAVERPGSWHPLVFYGGTGSGKTHLLQGVFNGLRKRRPASRVVYTTGHRFSRHYALTMRRRQTRRMRELYREVDALIIDDVHELAGKRGSERELCFTLDRLSVVSRCQVVLASRIAPHRLAGLDPGLQGRMLGGLVVPLRPPSPETRLEIVRARCAQGVLDLSSDVQRFLSEGVNLDARELLTALTRLEAHQRLAGVDLDLPRVQEILTDILEKKRVPASLEGIAAFVAERIGLSPAQLRGRSRKPSVVRGRQLAMALARELTPLTLREVGAFFGGRSCASVHFAQQRAAQIKEEDGEVLRMWGEAVRRFDRIER